MVFLLALKRRTTSAVLGPTPGNCISVSLAFSVGNERMGFSSPWYFSRIVFETCFIVFALFLYSPPTLRHCSISFCSAFASASGVILNLFERFSKAFAVFLSAVFCEIIVTISVLKGSSVEVTHFGMVKVFRSISRMFFGRPSAILLPRFLESDK